MCTTKLARLYLPLVIALALCGTVHADTVRYSITGGDGASWSGQFSVNAVAGVASDWEKTFSVSMDGIQTVPVNEIQINNLALYDNGWTFPPGYVAWLQRPPGEDATVYGLTVMSASLFTDVAGGSTWSSLISHGAYDISTTVPGDSYASFSDSSYTTYQNYGGQIIFSSDVAAVPEPGTWALLFIGAVGIGGYTCWNRRRTQPAS